MHNEVRVGIIGAGHWGQNLIRICHDLGALTAVCDPSPSSLQQVADKYPNVDLYSEASELVCLPIDAVLIAAPAELHAELALQALAAGKHVFIEKPFTLSVADGESVAAAAVATGLQVFVGHLLIYHPAVRRLRAIIASGSIGRVWHLRSRRVSLGKLRHRESVWWSFAPHDVSLMLALMGEEPTGVVGAQNGWLTARTPDTAYADYQFAHGRSAHIEVSWLDPHKMWQFDVFGTEGVITIAESPGVSRMSLARCGARSDERAMLSAWRGAETEIQFDKLEPLREEMIAFFTSLRFGIASETDASEGLAVVRALARADKASHTPSSMESRA
jgi:UDP-2-acetamido-3-amino-2,3-dideoxy-glucuronate N-acetyltransferase